jgi:transposase
VGQLVKTISQYWNTIQGSLLPWLEEELDPLTQKQQQLIEILELVRIEQFVPIYDGYEGRPQKSRRAIARSFVAKMVYNVDTTTMLIERLKSDKNLRRVCGWENSRQIPSESTFSRAFAEFAIMSLPSRVHEKLIKNKLSDEIVSHNSRDSTAIRGRENIRPVQSKTLDDSKVIELPKKRGRPKKGEEKPPQPTRLERQQMMTLQEMLDDLPKDCDSGTKKDSKGNLSFWSGYKLHCDIIDGCIPVSAIVTSASVHDSQVAIPLALMTQDRVKVLYDLMDSAYDIPAIIEHSHKLGHIPLVEKNPRRDKDLQEEKRNENKARRILNWKPAEANRYSIRTTAERANSRLKEEFGADKVRVRGHLKVTCHLMFGVLVLTADQLMRLAVGFS